MAHDMCVSEHFQPLFLHEGRAILQNYSQCSKIFFLYCLTYKLLLASVSSLYSSLFCHIALYFLDFLPKKPQRSPFYYLMHCILFSANECLLTSSLVCASESRTVSSASFFCKICSCMQAPHLPRSLLPVTIFRQPFILFVVLSFKILFVNQR